jgi:MYXO-CTERM domain-containing protein
MKLKGTVPTALNESPLIYAVERYDDASLAGGPVIASSGYVAVSWSSSATIRSTVNNLDGKALPEAFCFRVKTYDTAGNAPSVSQVLCKPCNNRVDSVPNGNFPPAEPTWTAADVYPGGPCNASTTATGTGGASSGAGGGKGGNDGDDDEAFGGCGCRVAGEGDTHSGLFGALALALGAAVRLGRRRR